MKLTKEDIMKYGTEDEKNILKELRVTYGDLRTHSYQRTIRYLSQIFGADAVKSNAESLRDVWDMIFKDGQESTKSFT